MPLLLVPQGQGIPVLDVAGLLAELYPRLGAQGAEDLAFWTPEELFGFANEAAARLALRAPLWVEREEVAALAGADATQSLPARHIATIHVAAGDRALRPATTADMDAFSPIWRTVEADPAERYVEDLAGTETLTLYPIPTGSAEGHLAVVFQAYPDVVSAGRPIMTAHRSIGDWMSFAVLGEARAKEGKGAMPEVAEWARGMAGLLEQAFVAYWGDTSTTP